MTSLDDLVRDAFERDSAGAPASAGLASAARSRHRRRRRRDQVLGGLSVLALLLGGLAVADRLPRGGDDSRRDIAADVPDEERPLERTEWQLLEYTVDGGPTTSVVEGEPATFRIADGRFTAQPCNSLSGPVTVKGSRLELGEYIQTHKMCHGAERAREDAVTAVLGDDVEWSLRDGRLRLESGRGSLLFRVGDGMRLDPDLTELESGRHGDTVYRLGWKENTAVAGQVVLQLETRAQDADPWVRTTHGQPDSGEPPMYILMLHPFEHTLDRDTYVGGFATTSTTRVTHTENGVTTELEVFDVGDWHVFGGVVPAHTKFSQLRAYDGAGAVTDSWGRGR